MNSTATSPVDKPKQSGERQAIPVGRLMIVHHNPHGVKMPDGPEGKGETMRHTVSAGIHGDIRTEIEFRPWMRMFRVAKTKKVTSTGANGQEVVSWRPMGAPFFIPEAWCVWVAAEE